ncbi:MAG: site-specific DNA-methyltransferase [Patescibacteria group bacterium]
MEANKVICGDCCDIMNNQMDADSVDLIITSPPYDSMRDYDGFTFDYKATAKSMYRVMKPGACCVWVVSDQTIDGSESGTSFEQALFFKSIGFNIHDTMIMEKNTTSWPAKKNGLRYSQIFEYMFVFSKGKPKFVKLLCDKPNKFYKSKNWGKKTDRLKDGSLVEKADLKEIEEFSPRNNIWKFTVSGGKSNPGFKDAHKHPAIFPIEMVRSHLLTWCQEGEMVLDPLAGSGTVPAACVELKRNYIAIDCSETYCNLMKNRLNIA